MKSQSTDRMRSLAFVAMTVIAVVFLTLGGCDPGGVDLVDPRDGNGDGAPQTFTLTAVPAEDSGLNPAALGWEVGIPETSVEALRVRDYEPIIRHFGEADGEGVVTLSGLANGWTWFAAERMLNSDEAAELLPPDAEVPFLGGGTKAAVSEGGTAEIDLRPARTGSMVISEIASIVPLPWEMDGGTYYGGIYIELFNNAQHTIFLDGMLLGKYYWYHKDYSHNGHHACSDNEVMLVDPEGVWSPMFYQFPGTGSDHPVAPGQTILVAMSATDHSHLHPMLPDLSHADFELGGGGFADNPDAPRLIDAGPRSFDTHFLIGANNKWFIADPVDVDGLLRMPDPGASASNMMTYARIPRSALHDAPSVWWDNGEEFSLSGGAPLCPYTVHPDFDAVPGGFLVSERADLSAQRRAVRTRDGRVVLLNTNVSAVDFVLAPLTPGQVPEVEEW